MRYVPALLANHLLPAGLPMDNVIASRALQVERKRFVIEFRENERGRFLRITEEAHGRRNTVIIPSTGVSDFAGHLAAVLAEAGEAVPAERELA